MIASVHILPILLMSDPHFFHFTDFDVQKPAQLRRGFFKENKIKSPPLVHILRSVTTNLSYTCFQPFRNSLSSVPHSAKSEVNGWSWDALAGI